MSKMNITDASEAGFAVTYMITSDIPFHMTFMNGDLVLGTNITDEQADEVNDIIKSYREKHCASQTE